MIIIVEGSVGSGKSSAAWHLANVFKKAGVNNVVVIDEPLTSKEVDKLKHTPLQTIVNAINTASDEGLTLVTRQRANTVSWARAAAKASGRDAKDECCYTVTGQKKLSRRKQ
jgi:thymidylate kinase